MDRKFNYTLYKRSLYLILFSLYVTPSIKIFSGLPAIRLEEILIILIIMFLFLRLLNRKQIYIAFGVRQKLLIGLFFLTIVSIAFGTIKGYSSSILEITEFIKLAKYLIIYTISLTFFSLSDNPMYEKEKVVHFVFKLSIFLFIITIQQYYNLFGLNERYVPLVAPTQYITLVGGYSNPRPVGMIGNPNFLAFLFVISSWLVIYTILKRKIKIYYMIVLILNITGMILTLSRTALVAFLAGVIILLLVLLLPKYNKVSFKNIFRIFLFTSFFIGAIIYVFTYTNFKEDLFWRYSLIFDLENDSSWQARLYNWQENINLFKESPFFGMGPLSRTELNSAADNEWLLILRTYGFVGTIYFLMSFIIPFIKSDSNSFKVLTLTLMIGAAIYMIPSAVFNSLIIMPLILILFSMSDSNERIVVIKR